MKKQLGLLSAIIFACLSACGGPADAVDSHGDKIRLSDYRGKWVFINYWATWCVPCRQEVPALEQLSQKYPDKIAVIGINFDGVQDKILNMFAKDNGLTYPLASQIGIAKYAKNTITAVPTTFVLDPQGNLVKTLVGPQTVQQFLAVTNLNTQTNNAQ